MLHPLNHQLRDAVSPAKPHPFTRVVVDQTHLDLAPVAGVHGARGVDDAQAVAGGQTRTRVDEGHEALGKRDGHPGADGDPLTGSKIYVTDSDKVGARIARMSVCGEWNTRVYPGDLNPHSVAAGHGGRDYPGVVKLQRRPGGSALSGATVFDERLSVPWWWWPPALGVVVLVAFEVNLGHPGVPGWLPVALLTPLVAWWLLRLGATRVTLVENAAGERLLRVGPARLPVGFVGSAEAVAAADKRRVLGPELDPAAYLVHRPWVGPMVRISIEDPDDPTPYWLFSVRRPGRLLDQLARKGPA